MTAHIKQIFIYTLLGIAAAVTGIGILAYQSSPYTGLRFDVCEGKPCIRAVDAGSPAEKAGVKPGDTIERINDIITPDFAFSIDPDFIQSKEDFKTFWTIQETLSETVSEGKTLNITIQRKGERFTTTLTPAPSPPLLQRMEIDFFLLYFFWIQIILSYLIIRKKFNEMTIVFFAWSCVGIGDISCNLYQFRDISFHYQIFKTLFIINHIGIILFSILLIHFGIIFPYRRGFIARYPYIIKLLYVIAAIFIFADFSGIYKVSNREFPFLNSLSFLLFLSLLIYRLFTERDILYKKQVQWVTAGFLSMLGSILIFSHIPRILFHETMPYEFLIFIPIFYTLFPLSVLIAVTRYRLMDIENLIDNTVIYTITLGILAVGDMWLITSLDKLKSEHLKMSEPLNTFIAVAFIISVYIPVRNRVRNIVKRLLKREVYDINEMSLKMSNYFIAETEIPVVIKKAMELITKCLHPRGGGIVMYWEKNSFSSPLHLWERIEERGIPMLLIQESKTLTAPKQIYEMPIIKDIPKDYTNGVIIPIIGSLGTIGAIILKDKHSDKLYSTEDINLLIMIAGQTATAIEIIKAKQGEKKKEEEIRQERERISREIHDGIGTAFTNAIVMTEMIDSPSPTLTPALFQRERGKEARGEGKILKGEGNGNPIENLRTLLTEGLTELRELIWAVEDKDHTLPDIASHIKDKAESLLTMNNIKHNVNIEIGLPPPSPPLPPLNPLIHKEGKEVVDKKVYTISPKKKLNMVRLMQEALGNIIKHADATEVDINIKEKDGKIIMEIKDNGKGFDEAIIQSKGYGLRNMKNRCDEMAAEFKIHSEIGKGTEIVVEMGV